MKKEYPVITSRQNRLVIETAALADKKARDTQGLFLIEGEKLVREASLAALPVERIFLAESRAPDLLPELTALFSAPLYAETELYVLSDPCFSKISSEKSPQGVIAVLKHLDFFRRTTIIYDEDILAFEGKRITLLCGMQDPGNLGTVIRSAVAFGTDVLIISADCADLYNRKTLRAAMGCIFKVQVLTVADLSSAVSALRKSGRRVLAAELREGAVPLDKIGISPDDCVMIGNEGHGIPPSISALCDASVYLPITERAESLNAAAAAAVFLWEQRKRQ